MLIKKLFTIFAIVLILALSLGLSIADAYSPQSEESRSGPDTTKNLTAVWGSGPDNLFVVGSGGTVFHQKDGAWSRIPSITENFLTDVWGSGPDDIFVVGYSTILRYQKGQWDMSFSKDYILQGVWGSGPTDVFAVGSHGTISGYGIILHHTGKKGEWQAKRIRAVSFQDVWGSGPNNVFAVGDGGKIYHYDGNGSWVKMNSNTSSGLFAVWGSGPNDVFAVGDSGVILHYGQDEVWRHMTSNTSVRLEGVWGSGPKDVYAVGRDGLILRYDGVEWLPVLADDSTRWLGDIWGSGPDNILAVGWGGAVRFGPWRPDPQLSLSVSPSITQPGQTVDYTLTYKNIGSGLATRMVLTNIIPVELIDVSYKSVGADVTEIGSQNYVWQVEDLAPGESRSIIITGQIDPNLTGETTILSAASIAGAKAELNLDNNYADVTLTVEFPTIQEEETLIYLPITMNQFFTGK